MSRMPDDGNVPLPEPPNGNGQWWLAAAIAVLVAAGLAFSLLA